MSVGFTNHPCVTSSASMRSTKDEQLEASQEVAKKVANTYFYSS